MHVVVRSKECAWQCKTLTHHLCNSTLRLPGILLQLARSHYDHMHLSVIVAVSGIHSTKAIYFALGVFQAYAVADSFNMIVQFTLDSVEQKQCGCQFSSDPETTLQSSVYADNIQFVISLVEQNQCLLNIFESFSVVVTNHVCSSKQMLVCDVKKKTCVRVLPPF